MEKQDLEKEANIFGSYLTGKAPVFQFVDLYIKACSEHSLYCTPEENKILRFIIKNSFFLIFIDAALAFSRRDSVIRKKIFLASAIVESLPDYSYLFLTPKRNPLYLIKTMVRGVRAVICSVIGIIILKLI